MKWSTRKHGEHNPDDISSDYPGFNIKITSFSKDTEGKKVF